jgi:hypothetical protein
MSNNKKTQRWLKRKKAIRNSATVDGRALADSFGEEGRALGYELDHILPLHLGGRHHRSNLQWLTKQDNRAKADKHWTEWCHPGGITCVPYPLNPDEYAQWLNNHWTT